LLVFFVDSDFLFSCSNKMCNR